MKHTQSLLENFKSWEEYVLYIDNFLEWVDEIKLQEIYDRARVAYFNRDLHDEVGREISAILDYLYVKVVYELNPKMYERDVQAIDTTFSSPLEVLEDDLPEDIKIIKTGDNISVHYEGRLENGEVFDSSYDRGEALEFTAAGWQMIIGFDEAVLGMKVGEKKTITLLPSEAYGDWNDYEVKETPKADLQSFVDTGIVLEIWVMLPTQYWELEIIAVSESSVTVDLNHPLAGETLIFDIEIVEIK